MDKRSTVASRAAASKTDESKKTAVPSPRASTTTRLSSKTPARPAVPAPRSTTLGGPASTSSARRIPPAPSTTSTPKARPATKTREEELALLKSSHAAAIATIETKHAAELEALRTELDQHRSQSSKLEGVEGRIHGLEEALRESKARASKNEEELQQTIHQKDVDRDQLANVVEDLKIEIDRCQRELDTEYANQTREKQDAAETIRSLGKELGEAKQDAAGLSAALKAAREELETSHRDQASELEKRQSAFVESESAVVVLRDENTELKRQLEAYVEEHTRTSGETKNQHEVEMRQLRDVIQNLQDDSSKLQQVHDEALALKDKDAVSMLAAAEKLQQQSESLQQQLEDARISKSDTVTRLSETIQSLREETAAHKQQLEDDANAKDEKIRQLNVLVEDLQHNIESQLQATEDAKWQAEREAGDARQVVDVLQHEVEMLKQKTNEEEKRRQQAADELNEFRRDMKEKYDAAIQKVNEMREERDVAVQNLASLREQHDSAVGQLENARQQCDESVRVLDDLRNKHMFATEQSTSLQEQHNILQKQHESLEEAHGLLESQHASQRKDLQLKDTAIQGLRSSLDDAEAGTAAHAAEIAQLEESHAKALETLKSDHLNAMNAAKKSLVDQISTDLIESELKLDATKSKLQTTEAQLKSLEGQMKGLVAEKAEVDKELGDFEMRHNRELEEETQRHEAAYRELQKSLGAAKDRQTKQMEAQIKKHELQYQELEATIEDLKRNHDELIEQLTKDHEAAVQSMIAHHEQNVNEVMSRHAAQIAEVEEEAAKRAEVAGSARDRVHGARMAALEAEHAEALAEAMSVTSAAHHDEQRLERSFASPKALSHIFVNHARKPSTTTSDGAFKLAETPVLQSPRSTHIYDKSMTPTHEHNNSVATLAVENPELQAALDSTEARLTALQNATYGATTPTARTLAEPFTPSRSINMGAEGHMAADGRMTLAGTIESLRVQMAQLLDVNEEFMEENRRLSLKLETRSTKQKATPTSSPMKAVS